jgi:4-hydroxybenzoate polyprenyl transferase
MGSMIFAFLYPFMKRITYWPQLFLGITFNWGLMMAWASMNNGISSEIIILYVSAIFWTLGYDTIYGAQDMSDDEIIGLKSTSIKFKKNIKMFVATCYFITLLILSCLFYDNIDFNIFTLFLIFFSMSLIFQIKKFRITDAKSCLDSFKINNISGILLFTTIFLINF